MKYIQLLIDGWRGCLLAGLLGSGGLWSNLLLADGGVQGTAAHNSAEFEEQSVTTLPAGARKLSTDEIRAAFANVRDEAKVQDAVGTRAVNHWYADGRFTNEWFHNSRSGKVTGVWRAANDRRCVLIQSGLTDRIGKENCSPVYKEGLIYFSLNPDGSVHGIHTLSPIVVR